MMEENVKRCSQNKGKTLLKYSVETLRTHYNTHWKHSELI